MHTTTKHNGPLNGIVLLSVVIISFFVWFPAGSSNVQINIPENLILGWIRETQCARLGGHIQNETKINNTSVSTNETVLWCSFIPEKEAAAQLKENGTLNAIWALIGAAVVLGGTFGVWIANMCIGHLGYRRVFLVANVLLTAGTLLSSLVEVSRSYEIFIIGRTILGAGVGFGSAVSYTYTAEITPANFRGAAAAGHIVSFGIGMLLAAVLGLPQILGTADHWSYLSLIMFVPNLCFFAAYPFLPESPRWLFNKTHDIQKVASVLQRLQQSSDVQPDIQMIEEECRAAQKEGKKVSIIGLFRQGFLRYNTIICCIAVFAQRFTAYGAVYTYSSSIFRQCGLTNDASAYGTIGLLGLQTLSALIGSAVIDKVGRKPLLVFGLFGCSFSLVAMVLFAALTRYGICVGCQYGNLAALFVFIIVFSFGPSGIPFILPAEMFGQLTRQSATTLVMIITQAVTTVISAVFPVLQAHLEEWTFTIFAGITFVLTVILAFTLVETKGKTFLEIQTDLEKRYYKRNAEMPVMDKLPSLADLKALPRTLSNISCNSGMKRLHS